MEHKFCQDSRHLTAYKSNVSGFWDDLYSFLLYVLIEAKYNTAQKYVFIYVESV